MKEGAVVIDNIKTNYRIAGSGPAVLVLHGWGSSYDSWKKMQDLLAKEGFFSICPDLPGFGKSQDPPPSWNLENYLNFVEKFIEKTSDIYKDFKKPFFLLGHSFGGRISIKMANRNPEKLKKLILCNAAGIKIRPGIKTMLLLSIAGLGNLVFSIKPLRKVKDSFRNFFYMSLRKRDYVKANRTMKEVMKNILKEDLRPLLPDIKTETLIVWGKKDKIVPVKCAYIFKKEIKDAKLVILPASHHSPHLESPEILSKKISEFLKNNEN